MKNINKLTSEERNRLTYRDVLESYRDYLSNYHWHLHITLRQGYNATGYTFSSKGFDGLQRRSKVTKKFLSKLRAKLKLKENQMLYAFLHEYSSGGHVHILVQFTKVICKKMIYSCLYDLKEDYHNKHFIIVHYRKGRSKRVWVVDQQKLVSYVTKEESNGIPKELETSDYLEHHKVSHDIFDSKDLTATAQQIIINPEPNIELITNVGEELPF